MKKVCLALALLLALSTQSAMAQNNAIKINYLSPIFRTLSLFYEHKFTDSGSGQLGFFYTGYSIGDTKFSGFGITPEFRYYLSDDGAIHGFYIAPYLRYQNFTLTEDYTDYFGGSIDDGKYEATLTTFGGGAVVGYQAVFKERVTFDAFAGPGFNSGSIKLKAGSESADFDAGIFDGFGLRVGSTIGIAF